MTASHIGVRRAAAAILALAAAGSLSACGAGMISQTANQAPAVDGGRGQAGDVSVNDMRIVLPSTGTGDPKLSFVASYTGYGIDGTNGLSLQSVSVGGLPAAINAAEPFGRNCALVVSAAPVHNTATGDACIKHGTISAPAGQSYPNGAPVSVVLTFSNGTQVNTLAGVTAPILPAGSYTRAAESAPAEH